MFTGIIEEMGQVSRIRNGIKSQQLSIDAPKLVPLLRKGDSVAVNGVCSRQTHEETFVFRKLDS